MKTRSDQTLVHDLRELIAALDRRVPRLEREGERDIARDAQALRRAALKRIAELDAITSGPAIGHRRSRERMTGADHDQAIRDARKSLAAAVRHRDVHDASDGCVASDSCPAQTDSSSR